MVKLTESSYSWLFSPCQWQDLSAWRHISHRPELGIACGTCLLEVLWVEECRIGGDSPAGPLLFGFWNKETKSKTNSSGPLNHISKLGIFAKSRYEADYLPSNIKCIYFRLYACVPMRGNRSIKLSVSFSRFCEKSPISKSICQVPIKKVPII